VAWPQGFSRLAIVTMHRGQAYDSLDTIKAELSPLVPELMFKDSSSGQPAIPFLSLGEDIGSAVVVHTGCSELSGELFVEDVDGADGDGFTLRRLLFGSNRHLIQSEARLIKTEPRSAPAAAAVDQVSMQVGAPAQSQSLRD
jgi:hypothetical protein